MIYTFYLKHQKYPFCAPIFHPLSETESYIMCIQELFTGDPGPPQALSPPGSGLLSGQTCDSHLCHQSNLRGTPPAHWVSIGQQYFF